MYIYLQYQCSQGIEDRELRLSGHVGFDSFPDQLVTKCVNKGFDFNILCIGNCLVGTCIYTHSLSLFLLLFSGILVQSLTF